MFSFHCGPYHIGTTDWLIVYVDGLVHSHTFPSHTHVHTHTQTDAAATFACWNFWIIVNLNSFLFSEVGLSIKTQSHTRVVACSAHTWSHMVDLSGAISLHPIQRHPYQVWQKLTARAKPFLSKIKFFTT